MLTKIPHTKKKAANEIFRKANYIVEKHIGIDRIFETKYGNEGRLRLHNEWTGKKWSRLYIDEAKKEGLLQIVDNRWYEFKI